MIVMLRLFHIVGGVLWIGALGVIVMFIMPAVGATGAIGGQFMQHMVKNTKLTTYMPVLGGLTVVSGVWMFFHDASISGGTFGSSRMGMTYSIGGAAAILALIVGGVMTGGGAGQVAKIAAEIAASGGPPSAEQSARMAALQVRMRTGARVSFALGLVAVAAMAVARYV